MIETLCRYPTRYRCLPVIYEVYHNPNVWAGCNGVRQTLERRYSSGLTGGAEKSGLSMVDGGYPIR